MVVHTPTKLEVQRQQQQQVPPAVAAAAAAAAAAPTPAAGIQPAPDGDLLGLQDPIQVRAEVHAEGKRIEVNVELKEHGEEHLRHNVTNDADRISLADDADTPSHPQLNPFTPEWFAQMITAAATAAATAVAGSTRPPPPPPTSSGSSAPRRLNERKVPDFWEDRPEFWFRIFDAHLAHFSPSEQRCFDTLLPLLTPAARAVVHSVIRTLGTTPYSKARESLLRHFGRTPRQLAREFMESRSLGDKLASEFLDHVVGLASDIKILYEVLLLDALPANARVAALQHTDVYDMARAADAVILENRALAESSRASPAAAPTLSALSLLDDELDCGRAIPPPLTPTVAAASRDSRPPYKKTDTLCAVHARWGKEAWKCLTPASCKMSKVIAPKPASASAPGNGKAGGRQ